MNKLKKVIKKALKTGEFKNHPEIFKFRNGLSMESIIYQWWNDMEDTTLDKISMVDELIRRIHKWLPETEEFDLMREKLKDKEYGHIPYSRFHSQKEIEETTSIIQELEAKLKND